MNHFPEVRPGEVWQHFKGGMYEIVGTGCEEDNNAERIVYRSLADSTIWLRAPWNFHQEVTRKVVVDGVEGVVVVKRFVHVPAGTTLAPSLAVTNPADPISDPAAATNEAIKERYPDRG